ncbi:MAG: tetratricopeptide repeat protein [Chthoniobacterales bacterium]
MRKANEFFIIVALAFVVTTMPGCSRHSSATRPLRRELKQALVHQNYVKAIDLSRQLVDIAPHENESWDRVVWAYLGVGDLDGAKRAIASWRVAVEKPSTKLDEYAGDVALREGDPATAVQFWTKLLSVSPTHLRVLEKTARAEGERQHWTEAEKAWARVVATRDSAVARVNHALSLRHLKKWEEALAELHQAQKLAADDPEVLRATGLFDRIAKVLDEIRELDARLLLTPQDFSLLADRALLLLRAGDPELALDDAQSAATLAPAAVRPKLFEAIALVGVGRADQCEKLGVETFIRLEALKPEFLETVSRLDADIAADSNNAELYVARAWQLNDIAQPRLALHNAQTALQFEPNSAGALAEAGYALAKLDRGDEAFDNVKRATEADPSFSTAWQYRGELEVQRGTYVDAVESLSRALTINQTTTALQKREECYRRLGLFAKAEEDHRAVEDLNARSFRQR